MKHIRHIVRRRNSTVATCSCGWTSKPRTFASQAAHDFIKHVREATNPKP